MNKSKPLDQALQLLGLLIIIPRFYRPRGGGGGAFFDGSGSGSGSGRGSGRGSGSGADDVCWSHPQTLSGSGNGNGLCSYDILCPCDGRGDGPGNYYGDGGRSWAGKR